MKGKARFIFRALPVARSVTLRIVGRIDGAA